MKLKRLPAICAVVAALWAAAAFALRAAAAPAPPQTVADAEKAYAAGDFATAQKLYNELAKKAPYDPALLYNLGTVYARQGAPGRATWRFLQALALTPRDASLVHNLTIVDPDFEQDLSVTPLAPLNVLFWRLTGNEWTAVAGGATLLAFLLLSTSQWIAPQRRLRGFARRTGIAALIVAVLCWIPAALRYDQEKLQWRGVVVVEGTASHTEPSATSFENFKLPAGKVVRVLDKPNAGWLKIGFSGDHIGFVPREKVEFL